MPSRIGPPPLLLTKRLTAFLHLNLTPTITTLLLLTPDGKLLAYAANPPTPVTTLRTHGTVAASLYAIHSTGTDLDTIDAALPPEDTRHSHPSRRPTDPPHHPRPTPLAVTIQLESGTVLVIRRLQCGMLFVSMGPPAEPPTTTPSRPTTQQAHIQPLAGALTSTTTTTTTTTTNGGAQTPGASTSPPPLPPAGFGSGSPSDVASVLSAATSQQTTASAVMFGAGTAGVMAARRHVEELARWLDEKLGPLAIPPNGFGGPV